MRTVEHSIEGEDLAALQAAMADDSGREGTIWSRTIDLGEGSAVELTIQGPGKDGEPWVDVILTQRDGKELDEPYSLDVHDGALAELILHEIDVELSIVEGPSPAPGM